MQGLVDFMVNYSKYTLHECYGLIHGARFGLLWGYRTNIQSELIWIPVPREKNQ